MRTMAVLAMVGVMAAGCTAKPEAQPEPQETGAAACAMSDLAVKATWEQRGGAGGHVNWVVLIRNVGKATCTLKGWPDVYATNPATKVHAKLNVKQGTFFDGDWQVKPATIKPGEPAALTVASGTGCNGGLGLTSYTKVEIGIGDRRWTLDGLEVQADEGDCLLSTSEWFTPAAGHDYG